MSAGANLSDRRIVLSLAGGMLLLVVLVAFFAPATRDDDPTPSTYNSGTHGAKAAFLLLAQLGYSVARSDEPATALDRFDAAHTTYVLAGPNAPREEAQAREYAAVERFLQRGGRVLATGFQGAYFVPGGRTGTPTQFIGNLCHTVPESTSVYAQVGSVELYDSAPWSALEPLVRVDGRCGNDAVIVHQPYPNGGEMVWWASSEPLSTRGLHSDASLRLLLAALGPPSGPVRRSVVFSEFYHGVENSPSDYLTGLPLRSLLVQAGLLAALLLFSYSRRRGPLREPVRVPRTSPVEFAQNMGALYARAGATQAATEAAHRRLLQTLEKRCGLTPETLRGSADEIAAHVHARLSIETAPLAKVLQRLHAARYEKLRPREALLLVRAADAEIARLHAATHAPQHPSGSAGASATPILETS